MPDYQYTAVFESAEEGDYVVTVPALPELVTEGDTLEEARAMVRDAIRGYLERSGMASGVCVWMIEESPKSHEGTRLSGQQREIAENCPGSRHSSVLRCNVTDSSSGAEGPKSR